MRLLLDSNIYDQLSEDEDTRNMLKLLVDAGRVVVLLTRSVAEELSKSRLGAIPNFFEVEYSGNTVARCGVLCVGDSLGRGEIYDAHLGKSSKVNDALIADAANSKADYLVSEDRRMLHRMNVAPHCGAMSYKDLVWTLTTLREQETGTAADQA